MVISNQWLLIQIDLLRDTGMGPLYDQKVCGRDRLSKGLTNQT